MRGLRFLLVSAMAAAGLTVATTSPALAADASVSSFSQCTNGSGTSVVCTNWTNGSIQGSNSHYREDDVVPQRAVITIPADSAVHTLYFNFQDRKGSVHAYDSLGTWNKTVTGGNPCQGLAAGLCAGTPSTWLMAEDSTNVPPSAAGISQMPKNHDLPDADRQWTMYGGVLVGDTVGPHSSPAAGDDLVSVSVSFRNPTPGTASTAVLLFGGHLAVGGPNTHERAWGENLGASSVSGGPYAFKLDKIDNTTIGATANSIQAGSTAPLAPAAFAITKTASTTTATTGQQVTYTITVKNTGGLAGSTTFTDDFADSITPSAVTLNPSSAGSCSPATVSGNKVLSCTTMSIPAGGQQTFTYTANMPDSFTGASGTDGCAAGRYAVKNTATLAAGAGSASVTVCVSAASQFTITKAVPSTTVNAGAPVTYTVTVKNTGTAAGSTGFTDNFDDRLSPSTATSNPTGNNCVPTTSGDRVFTCTTKVLAAGESQTFTYTATMPATFSGVPGTGGCGAGRYPVGNTATLSGTGGASSTVTMCVLAAPTFKVTKTADDVTADPGQSITYTIVVENTGNAAGSTSWKDDFDDRLSPSTATSSPTGNDCTTTAPGGNKLFDCTTGTIPAGGQQKFVYTATMPSSFSAGSGTGGCPTGAYPLPNSVVLANQATSSVTVCVGALANFTIAKSVDNATPAPGGTVTYTVVVKNTGAAAGSTSFTDDYDDRMGITLPAGASCTVGTGTAAGTFTCQTGTVAAGGQVTFTYTGVVPATFGPTSGTDGCASGTYPIANTATLASGPSAGARLCVAASPAYAINKSVDDATGVPGQVVTYTITVKNTGTAAGTTGFVDDFDDRVTPAGIVIAPSTGSCSITSGSNRTLSCSTGVIPAGSQQVFTYSVTLPPAYAGATGGGTCAPGTYRVANSATLTGSTTPAAVDVCVTAAPSFLVAKSVDKTSPKPGDTVTYTIKVTNNGTAAGSTTFVDDYDNRLSPSTAVSLPAGNNCSPSAGTFSCTTGTISSLGQQTFTYTATIPSTFSGSGGEGTCAAGTYRIRNDVTLANNATDAVVLCVAAKPDFAVDKTVKTDGHVDPGDTVEYTIKVTNNGDAAGSTTVVDDYDNRLDPTQPTGCTKASGKLTCTTGTIAAGGSESFVYTAVLPTSFTGTPGTGTCQPGEFQVANSVTVTGTTAADAVDVCVPAAPAFDVTKTASSTRVDAGGAVTYTIKVKNTGTAPGSTQAVDNFDDRLDPPTATSVPAGNDCAPTTVGGDEQFRCPTAVLDPGQSQTFTYTVLMPASFAAGAATGSCPNGSFAVVNSVQVTGDSDAVTVCVAAAPAFTVTKTASSPVASPGGSVDYVITVRNTGTAAGSTTFTDDAEATIGGAPDGCALVAGHHLDCTTGVLAAGASAEFRYTATVPATYTGDPDATACNPPAYPVRNTATLANGTQARTVVCVGAAPAFSVTKAVDDALADPGQTVRYTITVTNNGTASGSTTIVDDYDNRLDPSVPAGCDKTGGTLVCATGVLAAGASKTFEYDAKLPATYSGDSGVAPCGPGEYGVVNKVRIGGDEVASRTVCVPAAPKLGVTKTVSDQTPDPGETVTYTITVGNTGSVAGSTSFTDDFDDRLSPSTPDGCTKADGKLSCTTGSIQPGATQVFTYTATMPNSFTGAAGGGGCPGDAYPVGNSVVITGGGHAEVTACITARPDVVLTKASSVDVRPNGDQVLTYTLTWTNNGAAEANGTVLTDALPAGTGFVSCTGGCSVGGSPATATWQVGTIAPRGGTGSVTLVVKVTNNALCTVPNQARMQVTPTVQVSSNQVSDNVTPQADPSSGKANGEAIGLEVRSSGLLTLITGLLQAIVRDKVTADFSNAVSSQSGVGGPTTDSDSVLALKLPANGSVLSAGVLTTTSASTVTAAPAEARQTTTAEVAGVCLVPVAGVCTVETGTVRAVASTTANGGYATASSTGSAIQSLKVLGLDTPVNLDQTTTIPLNAAVFGKNSYVAINERTSATGLKQGKYYADQGVTMIHVKITGLLLGVQAVEIKVASATAHSEFLQTPLCGNQPNRSVSGHAFNARLFTGPLLADLTLGYTQIAPLGGAETEHIAGVALPNNATIVGAQVADSASTGSLNSSGSTARSWAEIAGDGTRPVCVLRTGVTCVVSATVIRSEARSNAGPTGSTSTDTGTTLVGLNLLGVIPIQGTPAPNTTLALPGIGFIVLNEQFCDGGGAASHACAGTPHSGITVRAVRVVVTLANNLLGLTPGVELVVGEAHADSSFG
jgi:uncharacterized repeat protein (TIGR01451 family)/fimbrial isopeptide formation D2 family protein